MFRIQSITWIPLKLEAASIFSNKRELVENVKSETWMKTKQWMLFHSYWLMPTRNLEAVLPRESSPIAAESCFANQPIVVSCEEKEVTIGWDHRLTVEELFQRLLSDVSRDEKSWLWCKVTIGMISPIERAKGTCKILTIYLWYLCLQINICM